jgi:hypothetical protein
MDLFDCIIVPWHRVPYFPTRFTCARDEVLHDLAIASGDHASGDVESPIGWYQPIIVVLDELVSLTQRPDVLKFALVGQLAPFDLVGFFMIGGDELGFTYVSKFDTEAEMNAEYERLEAEYGAWADEGEAEDLAAQMDYLVSDWLKG